MPEMEFADEKKGEALYAMELALSLEKLNFQKLRALHAVADKHSDAALCDFIEGDLLQEQVWHPRACLNADMGVPACTASIGGQTSA